MGQAAQKRSNKDPLTNGGRSLDAIWLSPNRELTQCDVCVLEVLGRRCDFRGSFRDWIDIRHADIAFEAHCSVASARRSIDHLVELGYIARRKNLIWDETKGSNRQVQNSYALTDALFEAYLPVVEARRLRVVDDEVPPPRDEDAPPASACSDGATPLLTMSNLYSFITPETKQTPIQAPPIARVDPRREEEEFKEADKALTFYETNTGDIVGSGTRARFREEFAEARATSSRVIERFAALLAHPNARLSVTSPNVVWDAYRNVMARAKDWDDRVEARFLEEIRRREIRTPDDVTAFGRVGLKAQCDLDWFTTWSRRILIKHQRVDLIAQSERQALLSVP